MIKRPLIYSIIFSLLLIGCATKSYVRFEDEQLYERTEQTDSSIFQQIETEKTIQFLRQDSLFSAIQRDNNSLFLNLMDEIYQKNIEIDSLQNCLQVQSMFIDTLMMNVDTLQGLHAHFEDADYSAFDFSRIKTSIDSLMINQKHLSHELQYMIRDLNLIERNLMDIIKYSMNSMKVQIMASNDMMNRSFYKNNATAYKMIMIYLMSHASSEPEKLLTYIDSVYAMGNALDTVTVQFGKPSTP